MEGSTLLGKIENPICSAITGQTHLFKSSADYTCRLPADNHFFNLCLAERVLRRIAPRMRRFASIGLCSLGL